MRNFSIGEMDRFISSSKLYDIYKSFYNVTGIKDYLDSFHNVLKYKNKTLFSTGEESTIVQTCHIVA